MIPKLPPGSEVAISVVLYSICSGTLVLLNKLILHHLPYPSLVIVFQLCAAVAFIVTAKKTKLLEVDDLKKEYVIPYLYYIIAFAMGVYCNMRSLNVSNVETVIVFRALSPCVVAMLDAMFLGREFPSQRSWTGIALIVFGAYGYASYDEEFQNQGLSAYFWPFLYMCIISFEMAYGKKIIRSVDLKTLSGPVYYTNLLGITPMLIFAAMGNEYSKFYHDVLLGENSVGGLPLACIPFLILGCAAGTGIGYSSWWCRDKVSATSFTIIGVMNKCLTIMLNFVIWDNHAKPAGIACLLLCLVGGSVYQQAPMKKTEREEEMITKNGGKESWKEDLANGSDGNGDEEAEPLTQRRKQDEKV